jgi:hypothetical protein
MMLQALLIVLPTLVESLVVGPLIEKHLPGKLPQGLTASDLGFKIEKIGLTHLLVTRIKMGQVMSADLVDIQYEIKNLKTIALEKITISGLTLYAQVDADNQLRINGKKLPQKNEADPGTPDGPDAVDSPPLDLDSISGFLPRQVVLKEAVLSIATPAHEILVPFEVRSSLDILKKKAVVTASFHPFGQTVKAGFSGSLDSGIEAIKINAPSFHPEVLSGFLPENVTVTVSGPVDIEILKNSGTDWQLSLSQLKLLLPNFPGMRIKDFKASVKDKPGTIGATGSFDLTPPLGPDLGMRFDLHMVQKEGALPFYDLSIKNKESRSFFLAKGPHEIRFDHPSLLVSLKGDLVHQTGAFLFACQNLVTTQAKEQVTVKSVVLKSGIKGDFSDKGKGIQFDLESNLSQLTVSSKKALAAVAGVNLSGRVGVTKQFFPQGRLDVRLNDGSVESREIKAKARGINARLPLIFPFKGENNAGSFSIREIEYDQNITAALKGSITQKNFLGIAFSGKVTLPKLDGFNLDFTGSADMSDPSARIDFWVDPFSLMPVHLKKIIPKLNMGNDSRMQVSSKGSIEYTPQGLRTQAAVKVAEADLFFPDTNLSLKGIAGSMEFNDLMVPESIPGQELTIDKIQVGRFEMDNAKVRFSVEDGRSVNIENLRFNWCNGLVSTESIRLPGKDNLYSLILYCDRLELSRLLKQMGAFHAEGEGSLSGRIPVVYSGGNISFDKGFLFSTPGKGGRVMIKNTQNLTAGIPMDTPEFGQLDLAREALKDFDYQWAKLELNTSGDTLFMKMELDGKPAGLLPFEYKKEVGSFVRVDASSPGSRFQGIKLNVNLKLPFNQVLKFGNKLNRFLN